MHVKPSRSSEGIMLIPNIKAAHCGLPPLPPKLEHKSPIIQENEIRKQNKQPKPVMMTFMNVQKKDTPSVETELLFDLS